MFHRFMRKLSPAQIVALGFAAVILLGALLLMLPFATRDGQGAPFLTGLFTATSTSCVTGLTLIDPYTYYTPFGQAVMLVLIQIGGLGVVTMAMAMATISRRRIGLQQRILMQESISAPQMGGIVKLVGFILRFTAICEGVGAILLATRFIPAMGWADGIWAAVFTSVSAFCNAGFDINGILQPGGSLIPFWNDPVVLLTVAFLIIIGGIGFLVWKDIQQHGIHLKYYRLQTKLVLVVTGLLILLPTLFFLFYEFNPVKWPEMNLGERILSAFFQAVTPRTAGFMSLDMRGFSQASLLLVIVLMLIGGSPGSTAGGIKTTSLGVLFLSLRSCLTKREHLYFCKRRLPDGAFRNTMVLLCMFLTLFVVGTMALCCLDGLSLVEGMFEVASALGTVGLSLSVTPTLGAASQIVLILLMYLGRIGGLTLLYAMNSRTVTVPREYPEEPVNIG